MRHARIALVGLIACHCTHPGNDAPMVLVPTAPPIVLVANPEAPQPVVVQVQVAVDPPLPALPPPVTPPPTTPGPAITCPASVTILAGRAVTLTAAGVGAGPLRYRWTVPAAPNAEVYRFSQRYDRSDSDSIVGIGATVPFTSVLVGTFSVHAEVRDGSGQTAGCDVPVLVQPHGLRVELSWDTDNTDVDLHMLSASTPNPQWFSATDCYYANLHPDAALGGEAVQRWLDRDDTDGYGPENIRVDEPAMNTDYTVGVNYYSSHSQHGATHATVVVYCGNEQVARMQRSLEGDRGGPYLNDFWTVGVARVDGDGRCGFRRVDRLGRVAPPGQ